MTAKKRIGSVMKLLPGFEAVYEKRHREIWPELVALLKQSGISGYSIFLDPVSLNLFACMDVEEDVSLQELPAQDVMQRWWDFMKDIMETNEDNSPRSVPLKEVFYLP